MNNTRIKTIWTTIVYDKHLVIEEVINPQPRIMLQHRAEELPGMDISTFEASTAEANKAPAGIIADRIRKARDQKRNIYFEYASLTEEGTSAYVVCHIEYAEDGRIYQYLVEVDGDDVCDARKEISKPEVHFFGNKCINDTCLRKKYQKMYDQSRAILDALQVGVEIYAPDGTLEYINQYDCDIFGIDREEILATGINMFDNPNMSDQVKDAVRESRKIQTYFPYYFSKIEESDYYNISEQKGTKHIECHGTPLLGADGAVENYMFIITDITESHEQAQALEETRCNLAQAMEAGEVSAWSLDLRTNIVSTLHGKPQSPENSLTTEELFAAMHPDDRQTYIDIIESISSGASEHGETVVRFTESSTGTYSFYESRMGAKKDMRGNITHITGLQRDITEQSLRKQELDNARKSLDLAIDVAEITVWSYDIQTEKKEILHGGSHDIDIFSEGLAMMHPGDYETFIQRFNALVNGKNLKDISLVRIKRGRGDYRYYESIMSLIQNDEGKNTYVIGSLKDVTETLSIEAELKQQKEFISLALEAGHLSIWIYDVAAEIFSSLEGETIASQGLSMEQTLQILHPDDATPLMEKFRDIIHKRVQRLDMNLRFKDPEMEEGYRHYETSIIPILNDAGLVTHLSGTQKDVTTSFLQQAELRRSKHKTDIAISAANNVLWEFDSRTNLFTCYNEPLTGFVETMNLRPEDYIDAAHIDDKADIIRHIELMNEGRDETFSFEMRMKIPGAESWEYCTITGSPLKTNENKKITQYVGIRRNDTELHKKTEMLKTILNNIPVPVYIKDENHHIIFRNDECNRIFGGKEDENGFYNFIDPQMFDNMNKNDDMVFSSGIPYTGPERITMLNGKELETIIRKRVIHDGDQKILLCVRLDESQQNEMRRKSKILSISVSSLDAYTWYYDVQDERLTFGDGFENTGGNAESMNTFEKYGQKIHPDDRSGFFRSIENIMKMDSGEFTIEYRIDLSGNGNYRWWECRGAIETTHTGKFMYGMDINIDSHKNNELALLENKVELASLIRQNELVLNNTNSGLAYISTDYVVQWENVSICSASISFEAYKKGELCYKSAHNRNSPCENCVMQRAARSRQVENIVFDFENGRAIEVFASPVFNDRNDVEGVVIRVDDITERNKMIADLQKAKIQAEQSDKLKSAFLANMSHEIRTPLNAIVGFSDLMTTAETDEEKEEYNKIITTNNELLLKLINDILDLSKIEAKAIDLKYAKFDMAEYFNEIALSMQRRIVKPDIELICTNPYGHCMVELDKSRLTQILTNYVTNAIKYTSRGTIEMGYEHLEGNLRIYVKDTGIGIAEDKKDKVFNRFEKLDEFAQGTGLGLSICKALADAFSGVVWFESEEGVGSTFWLSIPCTAEISDAKDKNDTQQNDNEMTEEKITTATTEKKHILVAEDILSNYLLIAALLKKEYKLTNALNGREAVDIVRTQPVDLVLMDMKMPILGGMEATAEIRKFNKTIPIIALTAHAFETDRISAMEIGCNEYLVKPLDREDLLSTLEKFLR